MARAGRSGGDDVPSGQECRGGDDDHRPGPSPAFLSWQLRARSRRCDQTDAPRSTAGQATVPNPGAQRPTAPLCPNTTRAGGVEQSAPECQRQPFTDCRATTSRPARKAVLTLRALDADSTRDAALLSSREQEAVRTRRLLAPAAYTDPERCHVALPDRRRWPGRAPRAQACVRCSAHLLVLADHAGERGDCRDRQAVLIRRQATGRHPRPDRARRTPRSATTRSRRRRRPHRRPSGGEPVCVDEDVTRVPPARPAGEGIGEAAGGIGLGHDPGLAQRPLESTDIGSSRSIANVTGARVNRIVTTDRFARPGSGTPRRPDTYTHNELCLSVPPASAHSSPRIRSVDTPPSRRSPEAARAVPAAERTEPTHRPARPPGGEGRGDGTGGEGATELP